MKEYRIENDSMGELKVPSSSYYGAQTMRAIQNFPISDLKFQDSFIKALAQIKLSAAEANFKLNLLEEKHKHAIVSAWVISTFNFCSIILPSFWLKFNR